MANAMDRNTDHRQCPGKHPPLAVGNNAVIYGGSCRHPAVDADIYVGFEHGMKTNAQSWLFPIRDFRAPETPADIEGFKDLVAWVSQQLDAGRKVHAGCIAGHGRTGTFLAALVATRKVSDDPIAYVRENYCPCAVETPAQVKFLVEHFGCKPATPRYP
jgi:protein-tyrosine phosphatase